MKNKIKYKEGDWFAIPLEQGGYGLGLIARFSRSGTILGYFFGLRTLDVPTQEDTSGLKAENAVLVEKFGDLGIIRGQWPLVCSSVPWQREAWPLPSFGYIDTASKHRAFLRTYNEQNLNEIISDVPITQEEARALPEDGLSGHIALITRLSRLL